MIQLGNGGSGASTQSFVEKSNFHGPPDVGLGGISHFCFPGGKLNLRLIDIEDGSHKFISNVGTVNYESGMVKIVGLKIESYDGISIKIYARTDSKDIISYARTILTINPEDINITVRAIRE